MLSRLPLMLTWMGVALVLVLGGTQQRAHHAEAAVHPSPKFDMAVVSGGEPGGGSGCDTRNGAPALKSDAICAVPPGGSFVVEVQLTDPGPLSGQVNGVQAVIAWTEGLQGPGDPSSTKAVTAENCPDVSATAAPVPLLGIPHSAAAACTALPPPLTDAEATGFAGRFELNCPATPSQQIVAMIVVPASPQAGTHITDGSNTPFLDKDGNELITIYCGDPPVVGGIVEVPDVAGASLDAHEAAGVNLALMGVVGAAVAAGAVAIAGGAWYLRRRVAGR